MDLSPGGRRQAELGGDAFPSRAWERQEGGGGRWKFCESLGVGYNSFVMKRFVVGFLVGGLLGVGGGAGVMLIAFPFLFPPPEVNETVSAMSAESANAVVGESVFREGVAGQDPAHWGKGGVKFYRAEDGGVLMELQADFEVGPGPNFWIYLNSENGVDDEAAFQADAGRVKVAKLKSFSGSQVYALDAERFAKAKSVTIWCESFNQYIASADVPVGAVSTPPEDEQ